ncbi:MAG: CNNM domain-containing protein [Candidatus Saliniplasma sp.]
MDWMLIIYLVSLAVLVYLSGRFSGSETALTSLSKMDLAHMRVDNKKNAEIIYKLKSDMDKTIITILIGNNLVNVTASAIATVMAYDLIGSWGVSLTVGILTIVLLIFGEITPKGFAIKNNKHFSIINAKLIYYLSIILNPLILLLDNTSDFLIDLFGGKTKDEDIEVTESDVRKLASILEREGVIKEIEKDILHQVFWFGDVKVKDVKVPKEDTFVIDEKLSVDEGKEFIKEHGFTRIPVTKHESNEVIGILYSKDLLSISGAQIGDFIGEDPFYVSNKDEITDVFEIMRRNRIHMAIVVDEKGKFDGVITLEDILEELLGEIYDEFD